MSKTNAFSKNTKKEMKQENCANPVTLDFDDLSKIEKEEGIEKTWQRVGEKFGKKGIDERRKFALWVWEFMTKSPKLEWVSAEWHQKYKGTPFNWEGFNESFGNVKKKESILPEEVEDSFQRLSRRKSFITYPKLIKDMSKLVPFRLDGKYLVEKTETSEEIIEKYQKLYGNDLVTYIFMIPKEEYKEGKVPTFGDKARKVLLATVGFAIEEKTLHPRFRKYHILKFINKDKINNRDYSRLDNIFQTLAFASYDISNKKKGKEYRRSIGHIIDNVDWLGKGKNAYICVSLNRRYFSQLASQTEEKEALSAYLDLPKDRLIKTEPRDAANFLNWVDSLKGFREVYPIIIKTLFTEKLGYTKVSLEKLGGGKISAKLQCCLDVAINSGRLRDPYWKYDYGKGDKSIKNILNQKLRIYLTKQGSKKEPDRKPDRRGKKNSRWSGIESEKFQDCYEL